MIEMRRGRREDLEEMLRLEELVFGPDSVRRGRYETLDPEDTAVLRDEAGLAGLWRTAPGELVTPGGECWKAPLLEAFCVRPDARGRGHGQQLSAYLDFALPAAGCAGAVLPPVQADVKGFFRKMGFEDTPPAGEEPLALARWYFRGLLERYPGSVWRRK